MTPRKASKPSADTSAPWISVRVAGQGCYVDGQSFVGKWLIFVTAENVDNVWARIERATENSQLGISAKVSTAVPNGYGSSNHVICVYTNDFRDKEEVGRALKALRQLRITGRIYYKTDQATLSGLYGSNGPFTKKKGRASLYSRDDFET